MLALLLGACAPSDDGSPHRDILGTEKALYSQGHEEVVARDYFQDRRGGVFLDVGSADYRLHSTTYYLEKHLGWTGVAVDAVNYGEAYAEHRPGTQFFHHAVTDRSGTLVSFHLRTKLLFMSSLSKTYADEISRLGHDGYVVLEVPSITLDDLLEKAGVDTIDFLSMDIEGSEGPALAAFDIDRFQPALVCIEGQRNRTTLLEYFTEHGYRMIERYSAYDDRLNWFLERRD